MKKLILGALALIATTAGAANYPTESYSDDLKVLTIKQAPDKNGTMATTTCWLIIGEPVTTENIRIITGYRRYYTCDDQTMKIRYWEMEPLKHPEYKSVGE